LSDFKRHIRPANKGTKNPGNPPFAKCRLNRTLKNRVGIIVIPHPKPRNPEDERNTVATLRRQLLSPPLAAEASPPYLYGTVCSLRLTAWQKTQKNQFFRTQMKQKKVKANTAKAMRSGSGRKPNYQAAQRGGQPAPVGRRL
jgi:hypothetical protein